MRLQLEERSNGVTKDLFGGRGRTVEAYVVDSVVTVVKERSSAFVCMDSSHTDADVGLLIVYTY